jgi:replication factor A1
VKVTKEIRRYDGSWNRQAECVVGDEQGIMDFLAQNEQLDVVKEGATITVRNGHAKVLRDTGRIKLIVDKWGKVEPSKQAIGSVNTGNNISLVEYELVPAGRK